MSLERIEQKLKLLEQRLELQEIRQKRSHEHLLNALAAQRGRAEKAFDEVKLALLEQELAVRGHLQEVSTDMSELRAGMTDLRESVAEILHKIEDQPPAA